MGDSHFATMRMRRCIEKMAMGVSGFILDCGGEKREVHVDCDVKEIIEIGGNVGSEFNYEIQIAEEINKLVQLMQRHLSDMNQQA